MSMDIRKNQDGIVSIVACMIIMIVLSLVVVGFASLMSREQRQAIDRQLSSQAFYAAESGINDALLKLQTDPTAKNLSDCSSTNIVVPNGANQELDATGPITYTCVLVNPTPETLEYGNVSTDSQTPQVLPLRGYDPTTGEQKSITALKIEWQAQQGSTPTYSGAPTIGDWSKTVATWVPSTGIIKATLTPFSDGDSRQNLIDSQAVAFMSPGGGGGFAQGSLDYSAAKGMQQNALVGGSCSAAADGTGFACNVTVNNISYTSSDPTKQTLFVVLGSLYRTNAVRVTAFSGSDGTQRLMSKGIQAVIDANGRANDVSRHIQVRESLKNSYTWSTTALDSAGGEAGANGLCKLILTGPTSTVSSDSVNCPID